MLRGIFMPAGVTQDQVNYYVDIFKKVRELPEWKKYTEDAAFNTTFMTGKEFADWVRTPRTIHNGLMQEAGFLASEVIEQWRTTRGVKARGESPRAGWSSIVALLFVLVRRHRHRRQPSRRHHVGGGWAAGGLLPVLHRLPAAFAAASSPCRRCCAGEARRRRRSSRASG